MRIYLVKGKGKGSTPKSAFDDALRDAGIHNFNLIPLSSIIPEGVEEIIEEPPKGNYGDRAYVIIAYKVGKRRVAAGLGIAFDKEQRKGVVVEAEGEDPEKVREELEVGLAEIAGKRDIGGERRVIVEHIEDNEEKYICALVALVIKVEGWWHKVTP